MPIKFLLLGGVLGFFFEGGVEVPILFLWAWGFFRWKIGVRFVPLSAASSEIFTRIGSFE